MGMRTLDWLACSVWELTYKNLIRARFIPGSQKRLLRVALRTYRGSPVELPDCTIVPGDMVAEMHLSNFALRRYRHLAYPQWIIYNDLIQELHLLSQVWTQHEPGIKALWAITLMSAPAVRLGFQVRVIPPGLWATLNYRWLRRLRRAYRPRGSVLSDHVNAQRQPCEIWMSAAQFQRRFAPAGSDNTAHGG